MAYLQEIRITNQNEAPIIGSTQDANVIWVVPVTDKVADMYTSDNNGIVRATSVQMPVFNSVEEANAQVPVGNRYEGKMVMIKKTYRREITNSDEEVVTETKDVYTLHWWKGGVADVNLITQAPSLTAVLTNGNRIPANMPLIFTSGDRPDVPEEFWGDSEVNEIAIWSGLDGTNFIASSRKQIDSNEFFYTNTLIKAGDGLNSAWGVTAIGSLEKAIYASATTAIGTDSLDTFVGAADIYPVVATPWGKLTGNIAFGYHAGKGLKEGFGNMYIGMGAANRPEEESNQLVVHNVQGTVGWGDDNPASNYYALIRGDFKNRWFQIAGKYRLNKKQNATITNYTNIDELAVLDTSASTYKELKTVNSKDYFIKMVEGMTEEQKTALKTALGL